MFILGSTGEGPSLSPPLRREFVTLCCSIVKDIQKELESRSVHILVGVSDTCTSETILLAQHAADCGADAVVIAPPYYFPISQMELKNYVQNVVNQISLPVFLYNMPKVTKITFEIETVKEIAKSYGANGKIAGIKDSSFVLSYISELCQVKRDLCPSWSVLTGAEHHVAEVVRLGGDGGAVGGSNIIPEAFVSFYKGAVTGDKDLEEKAFTQINALKEIYDMANGRFVQATKTSLSVLKICEANFASPLLPFNDDEAATVKQIIDDIMG